MDLLAPRFIGKRLALFFDGTWNRPQNNTNVWRLSLMLAETGADGRPQKAFYDAGVGTHWFDRWTGGMFGAGLSDNIRNGYRWLMQHYDPGDEIYLFGFSRGAFTARSLSGLIAHCGLLKPDAPMSFADVFERYRQGPAATPLYQLLRQRAQGEEFALNRQFDERVLLDHSWYHRSLIKMVGVWDTVGSLGVPLGNIPGISSRTLSFHDTHLSKVVEHSYQALALDEARRPFWAMLWTHFTPFQADAPESDRDDDNRFVEQRWFSGAHANVGGSYPRDLLPQRPLRWIQAQAERCGLSFRSQIALNDDDLEQRPHDSFREFFGPLRFLPGIRPYTRWVQSDPVRKATGWVETVNERVDESVLRRCQEYADYRPPSLVEWAQRKGYSLEGVISAPDSVPRLFEPVAARGIESQLVRASGW
ncbi:MAG TPA: DUF2235 domain-containing protein [Pirellulales bacterium]|jgi:uncharacterized protein (DUF2235 family)|nr:DUF2235 domain-containing protein [Pirellulales bacterium]